MASSPSIPGFFMSNAFVHTGEVTNLNNHLILWISGILFKGIFWSLIFFFLHFSSTAWILRVNITVMNWLFSDANNNILLCVKLSLRFPTCPKICGPLSVSLNNIIHHLSFQFSLSILLNHYDIDHFINHLNIVVAFFLFLN